MIYFGIAEETVVYAEVIKVALKESFVFVLTANADAGKDNGYCGFVGAGLNQLAVGIILHGCVVGVVYKCHKYPLTDLVHGSTIVVFVGVLAGCCGVALKSNLAGSGVVSVNKCHVQVACRPVVCGENVLVTVGLCDGVVIGIYPVGDGKGGKFHLIAEYGGVCLEYGLTVKVSGVAYGAFAGVSRAHHFFESCGSFGGSGIGVFLSYGIVLVKGVVDYKSV